MKPDETVFRSFAQGSYSRIGPHIWFVHCINPTCVMRSSTYVEDIDQKGWRFCAKCEENWRQTKG
ncbi:MAG: hypothetical protein IPF54_26070 [Draconibacterium sp.]|nr:hypothetical protein [Draconibacterium sp.]